MADSGLGAVVIVDDPAQHLSPVGFAQFQLLLDKESASAGREIARGDVSGEVAAGLIYMNARFYVPTLNRFASADTIVPDPANPQSFNRYSYVRNSPLNFLDPSGHCESGYADAEYDNYACWELAHSLSEKHGISVDYFGVMTLEQLQDEAYAQVLAFTLDRLDAVMGGAITDAEAAVEIFAYAIENVAAGDVKQGLQYLAGVIQGERFLDRDVLINYHYGNFRDEDERFGSTGFHSLWTNEGNE